MRPLGKVALLLVPVLAAGSWITQNLDDQDVTSTVVSVDIPQQSPDVFINVKVADDFSEVMDSEQVTEMDFEDNDDNFDLDEYNIEIEILELQSMKALLRDLEYDIFLREESLTTYISEQGFGDCDSLKCIFRTIFFKARKTIHEVAHHIHSKFAQETLEDNESTEYAGSTSDKPHWKKPHWKKPHFHHPPHGNHSHHNHTCHGNHTHHGNHSEPHPHPHPPPFWRRPHHLPHCHCPPPPPHGPPHHHPETATEDSTAEIDTPSQVSTPPGNHPEWRASRSWHKIHSFLKFFFISMMLLLLVAIPHTICKHCCSPSRRRARQARREERHRRRALRRAARRLAWKSWFQHHVLRCRSDAEIDEEEAMKRAMLAHDDADDMVGSEISQIRNAVSVVGDIVAAEEGRVSMDSRASLPDYMSQVGGERLPTYEDSDGSELNSVVADGFLYTPGSSEYTPGSTDSGTLGEWVGMGKQ